MGTQAGLQVGFESNEQLVEAQGAGLFGRRKKRAPQFNNNNSQIKKQVGLAGSTFNNKDVQVSEQFAAAGASLNQEKTQVGKQVGFQSNEQLVEAQGAGLFGRRKKRAAQTPTFFNQNSS